METISTTIAGACQATGLGKSKIYELISNGRLDTVKIGRRTLIKTASIHRLLEAA